MAHGNTLSLFVDESGILGEPATASRFYILGFVLHDHSATHSERAGLKCWRVYASRTILTPETVRRFVEKAMPMRVIGLPEGRKRSM